MPYDAFGNKVGKDPLAGLGTGAGSGLPGVPGGRPPRRPLAILVAVALIGVLGTVSAATVLMLADRGDTDPAVPTAATPVAPVPAAEPDPEPAPAAAPEQPARPAPAAAEPPVPAEPAEPPRGLQPGSLLRRANFTVALRRLRAGAKGEPRTLRVAAERIDVQVVLRDGRLRSAQVSWDGEVRVLSTTPTPIGGLRGYPWSAIDRGAPQRLARGATGRARRPASSFDYAVLLDAAGLRWSAFVKNGPAFTAAPSGRIERQIG